MAKATGKKARKSSKTDRGANKPGQKKPGPGKEDPKKPVKKAEASAPKGKAAKGGLTCDFCGKAMKDEKTKKLHERNCKPRDEPAPKPDNDFDTALMKLKDQFDDERRSMMDTFQERENNLQKELDEVKNVLRMEMDRHRKELDRIAKVEREVASEEKPTEQKQEPAPEPRKPEPQPRAIDMIPMHVPHIPRKKVQPLPDDYRIPDIDEEDELPPVKKAPEPPLEPSVSKEEIEAMVKELLEQHLPESPAAPVAAASDDLASKVSMMSGRLESMDSKFERALADLRRGVERQGKDMEFKRVVKELDKLSEKVQDIMDDSGFGESLSVMKIPPTILEIVYQATLDDILLEIMKTKGAQDAERIARSALEEVRLKTSGSELFKFDGRKIVTDNLARSIEGAHISAKQIQTTYDVLLEKLLETVPHHKAKNFKGMIKVKSQEFAVDRATVLTKEYARLERVIESTSQMVAAISAQFNARALELQETLGELRDKQLAAKASQEDLDNLRLKLQDAEERSIRLADDLTLLKAKLEMEDAIEEKAAMPEAQEDNLLLAPGEVPVVEGEALPDGLPAPTEDKPDPTANVLVAVEKGCSSKTAIMGETGLDEGSVLEAIAVLVEHKKVVEKKAGKRVKYVTPEKEIESQLKSEDRKSKSKKKKVPEPKEEPAAEPVKKGKKLKKVEKAPEPVKPKEEKKPARKKAGKPEEPPEQPKGPEKEERPKEEGAPEPKEEETPEAKEEKAPEPLKGKRVPKKKLEEEKAPEPVKEGPPKEPEKDAAEPAKDPAPVEIAEELPVERKKLEELTDEEREVLDAISEEGMTISGIQSKVGKHMKRFALLRALRVLIDSGYVGILTKGRMELYQRINVEKMDEPKHNRNKQEVK